MTKWKRLVEESNDKISFEEFEKMFWDYCEAVNEFFVLDGFKSENKKELIKKMDDFRDFVKWNTSREYQKIEPRWGQILDKVMSDLDDDICDADGDYRNSRYVYDNIHQLYYDFMNFHNVLGTKPYWELEPLEREPMNESDEKEDTFTRSNRPQIYKYYADDVTPVEKFVKKVRDAERLVEDIFIQNDDYYTSMPKEEAWDAFADDMCQGEQPEKALDLDYYMNRAAVDELPEDIKKYVNTSYGSGDFDAVQWLYGIFDRLYPICRDQVDESSRFGFSVGDKVELTKDKSNSFSGDVVKAGTQGEVVAVDKPMKGVIKVKIEGGKVISVPERGIKMAGTDNEPWEKFKKPEEPKRHVRPERPEDYYMRPTSYGSPRYTGD